MGRTDYPQLAVTLMTERIPSGIQPEMTVVEVDGDIRGVFLPETGWKRHGGVRVEHDPELGRAAKTLLDDAGRNAVVGYMNKQRHDIIRAPHVYQVEWRILDDGEALTATITTDFVFDREKWRTHWKQKSSGGDGEITLVHLATWAERGMGITDETVLESRARQNDWNWMVHEICKGTVSGPEELRKKASVLADINQEPWGGRRMAVAIFTAINEENMKGEETVEITKDVE